MNAAESLVQTAVAAGIEICFANPGTTEIPLLTAMDAVPGIRAVLGLFEGVCTGAADGYARMARKPALTLLHLGPGLANGIANLHNARRAFSPVVNLIGDQATWHREADAPLTSDIVSLAGPASKWVHSNRNGRELASDFAAAIAASVGAPRGVASLIVPSDCQLESDCLPAQVPLSRPYTQVDQKVVEQAAGILRSGKPVALLLGGDALLSRGLHAAGRISQASGCALLCDSFPARLERGVNLPQVAKVPYFPEQALDRLSHSAWLITAGTTPPVAFFGYAGLPSSLIPPGCTHFHLAGPADDVVAALENLASLLPDPARSAAPKSDAASFRAERVSGPLTPRILGEVVAAWQTEDMIVVDEGATSGFPHFLASSAAPPFSYLSLTGGAIGFGLPCATGAALACPDRRVLGLQADGSGLYTLQALWTQAREGLDVITIVCANRAYRILRVELARAGISEPGPYASALTDLARPVIDWVGIARGFGIPAARVESSDDLVAALDRAGAEPGPHLIEAVLEATVQL